MGSESLTPWIAAWAVLGVVVLVLVRRSWALDRAAKRAAALLGLDFQDTRDGGRITGTAEGFHVDAWYNSKEARVEVRGVSTAVAMRRRADDENASWLKSGDPRFDKQVYLDADRGVTLAMLDHETRRVLLPLFASEELRVENGAVAIVSGRLVDEAEAARTRQQTRRRRADRRPKPQDLLHMLRTAVAVATYVAKPDEPVDALLAKNAVEDPDPHVRLRNLLCLQEDYATSPRTAEAVQACIADEDVRVRLCAAWGVPAERGVAVARTALQTPGIASGLRKQAVALLSERLPRDEAMALGAELLGDYDARVRAEAIRRLAWLGARHSAKAIAARRTSRSAEERLAVVRALKHFGGPESALADLVQDPDDFDVRVEAARALARCGTVASISALHSGARGLLTPSAVTLACEQAIQSIRARTEGAGEGQLAIAEEPLGTGDLSLLQSEGGALAMADEAEDTRPRPRATKTTA